MVIFRGGVSTSDQLSMPVVRLVVCRDSRGIWIGRWYVRVRQQLAGRGRREVGPVEAPLSDDHRRSGIRRIGRTELPRPPPTLAVGAAHRLASEMPAGVWRTRCGGGDDG